MEWNDMTYAQTFSRIWIMTNGNSTIDVNMFGSEWTILVRLKFGGIKVDDKALIARLIVMMMMLTVSMMQVLIDSYLSVVTDELNVS
jgi:hypothetical protein